jgi:hypothetical protein
MSLSQNSKNDQFKIDNGLVVTEQHPNVYKATKGRFLIIDDETGLKIESLFVLLNRWIRIGSIVTIITRENENVEIDITITIDCTKDLPHYNEYRILW